MNDFGIEGEQLKWEATPPSHKVDFLDLHPLQLKPDGKISSASFQMPMNL
jgi:hypothetical protein